MYCEVEEQNLLAEEGRAAEPALDALDDVDPPAPAASPDIPLRTHYCKVCKLHVATFDHHCGVLGTCIGERNHCRFLTFLFFQMCALSVGLGVVSATSPHQSRSVNTFVHVVCHVWLNISYAVAHGLCCSLCRRYIPRSGGVHPSATGCLIMLSHCS